MGYVKAVKALLDSYLFSNSSVVITVSEDNQKNCQKIIQNLQHCNNTRMANTSYNTADSEMIVQARECDMSFGKYKMYLMLKEIDPTITLEEAKNMTMQEMHQRMGKIMRQNN